MKRNYIVCAAWLLLSGAGCAPAVIGGAVGGYSAATDDRTMGNIIDDSVITSKVLSELVADPVTKARNIDVDTFEGVVILTGLVDSRAEADRAVKLAKKVTGVKSVENNLQIGGKSLGQHIDDSVIVGKINAMLLVDPGIRSFNIDVDSDKGIVCLTGTVKNQSQKTWVLKTARTTAGVKKVIDNLKIMK